MTVLGGFFSKSGKSKSKPPPSATTDTDVEGGNKRNRARVHSNGLYQNATAPLSKIRLPFRQNRSKVDLPTTNFPSLANTSMQARGSHTDSSSRQPICLPTTRVNNRLRQGLSSSTPSIPNLRIRPRGQSLVPPVPHRAPILHPSPSDSMLKSLRISPRREGKPTLDTLRPEKDSSTLASVHTPARRCAIRTRYPLRPPARGVPALVKSTPVGIPAKNDITFDCSSDSSDDDSPLANSSDDLSDDNVPLALLPRPGRQSGGPSNTPDKSNSSPMIASSWPILQSAHSPNLRYDVSLAPNLNEKVYSVPRSVSPTWTNPSRSSHRLSQIRSEHSKTQAFFLVLLFTVLEYPPFSEVIHWDGMKRVVLERPQILELYILMPVFGIPTLIAFKQRLYALGFDSVALGQAVNPGAAAWEHITFTRLNPPVGFVSYGWSKEIGFGKTLRGPTPIPVSLDGGKLDWSGSLGDESLTDASMYLDPMIRHEKKLAAIRLRVQPKIREEVSRVAEDLQRRYDLLFLHLESQKPLHLTAALRWGISNSKIPAHTWKSYLPTEVIAHYLADESGDRIFPSRPEKNWGQEVTEFIVKCTHFDEAMRSGQRFSPLHNPPRSACARASHREDSRLEQHVSPDDDGSSKNFVDFGSQLVGYRSDSRTL